jgi:biopolymer transport protein ExbB
VWAIYHALVQIGLSGQGTLDKVAGPVGEALIMTAIGLAVAIPAVFAYNAFNRHNRLWLVKLDAFAHDLFVMLTVDYVLEERNKPVLKSVSDAS